VGSSAQANGYHVHVRGNGYQVPRPGPGVRYRPGPPVVVRPRFWIGRPSYYDYGYYPTYSYPTYREPTYAYAYPYSPPCCETPPPPAAYASPTTVVAAPRLREPTIGLGLRGSTVRSGPDHPAAEGVGALLRFRARPVELELEVGWDNYGNDTQRSDTRIATSLYVPIIGRVIVPYLVVGAGMNFANFGTTGDVLHQGFMSGGGGLAVNFNRSFALSADARYLVRHFFDNPDVIARQPLAITDGETTTGTSTRRDDAVELRANAIVYF
jgi:hypothetical protein